MEQGSKSPILFIVAGLLTVIFAFNNCGVGFEANSGDGSSFFGLSGADGFIFKSTYNKFGEPTVEKKYYTNVDGRLIIDGELEIGNVYNTKSGDTIKFSQALTPSMENMVHQKNNALSFQAVKKENLTSIPNNTIYFGFDGARSELVTRARKTFADMNAKMAAEKINLKFEERRYSNGLAYIQIRGNPAGGNTNAVQGGDDLTFFGARVHKSHSNLFYLNYINPDQGFVDVTIRRYVMILAGFRREFLRSDRDSHLLIRRNNMTTLGRAAANTPKFSVSSRDHAFDIRSVTNYSSFSFIDSRQTNLSTNFLREEGTILSKAGQVIYNRRFSPTDIVGLRSVMGVLNDDGDAVTFIGQTVSLTYNRNNGNLEARGWVCAPGSDEKLRVKIASKVGNTFKSSRLSYEASRGYGNGSIPNECVDSFGTKGSHYGFEIDVDRDDAGLSFTSGSNPLYYIEVQGIVDNVNSSNYQLAKLPGMEHNPDSLNGFYRLRTDDGTRVAYFWNDQYCIVPDGVNTPGLSDGILDNSEGATLSESCPQQILQGTEHDPNSVNGGWSAPVLYSGGCGNNPNGGSVQASYIRYCNNPSPSNGGAGCVGDAEYTRTISCEGGDSLPYVVGSQHAQGRYCGSGGCSEFTGSVYKYLGEYRSCKVKSGVTSVTKWSPSRWGAVQEKLGLTGGNQMDNVPNCDGGNGNGGSGGSYQDMLNDLGLAGASQFNIALVNPNNSSQHTGAVFKWKNGDRPCRLTSNIRDVKKASRDQMRIFFSNFGIDVNNPQVDVCSNGGGGNNNPGDGSRPAVASVVGKYFTADGLWFRVQNASGLTCKIKRSSVPEVHMIATVPREIRSPSKPVLPGTINLKYVECDLSNNPGNNNPGNNNSGDGIGGINKPVVYSGHHNDLVFVFSDRVCEVPNNKENEIKNLAVSKGEYQETQTYNEFTGLVGNRFNNGKPTCTNGELDQIRSYLNGSSGGGNNNPGNNNPGNNNPSNGRPAVASVVGKYFSADGLWFRVVDASGLTCKIKRSSIPEVHMIATVPREIRSPSKPVLPGTINLKYVECDFNNNPGNNNPPSTDDGDYISGLSNLRSIRYGSGGEIMWDNPAGVSIKRVTIECLAGNQMQGQVKSNGEKSVYYGQFYSNDPIRCRLTVFSNDNKRSKTQTITVFEKGNNSLNTVSTVDN